MKKSILKSSFLCLLLGVGFCLSTSNAENPNVLVQG